MQNKFTKFLPWFFFAAAFQSLIAIVILLRIPSEGISFARLVLLGVMGGLFLAGIGLGLFARRDLSRFERFITTPVILFSALLTLTFSLILFLLRYLNPERLLPFYERLSPLLWLLFFLAFEATIFLLLLKNGFHSRSLSDRKPIYLAAFTVYCSLIIVFLFVAITKIGITPDTGYWGEPGVAIQGWHFVVALLIGFSTLLLSTFHSSVRSLPVGLSNSSLIPHPLSFIPFALYLLAAILWPGVPLETLANSFYVSITPPTNMPLPYSDAGFYDFSAQSLLIGTGYFGGIPPRPLYVVFLAFLHLLFDQSYPAIIAAQTLVLALFPVALYFLAKKLHSPAAGVTVALFAIFREYTGLWIASNTRVANSKVFTTDFPTAFSIVIICLVILWWLERRDLRSTLITGGAFGVFLLFRTQSMLTLPFLFLLVLLVLNFKWGEWIKAGIVFAATMLLAVLPWLTHNYTISGKFSFDDPNQVAIIYSQYAFTGNLDLSQFDPKTDSVRERIVSFTLENPAYVANFITSHFLNTEIGGLLSLPLIKPFNGLQEPVNLYWVEWNGTLEWYNIILLLVYLALIAIGFGAAWRRMRWLSLIPLVFNLGYALSNGIARFSSWRYNMPVDWVVYFYFAIGVAEIFGALPLLFGVKGEKILTEYEAPEVKTIQFGDFRLLHLLPVLAFVFVGSLPWLAKGLAEPRYTSTQDELIAKLESSGYDRNEIQAFLQQPKAVLAEGRLLFPRMYWRGEGLSSANPWPAYVIQDFPRIGFILINSSHQNLIYPTKELLDFPQGADSIVLACSGDNDLLNVRVVTFKGTSYQSAPLTDPCPDN
ncbi:MAG: glycosyltransferase family 39 protein [Chloroflexi bacterium]|nr:glycosyltransferase family 39 protein [Chloroflexota bacterium]